MLDHNNITIIPLEIKNLTKCTTMNFSYNNINDLPVVFGDLTQLIELNLFNNPNLKEPFQSIVLTGNLPFTENIGWISIKKKLYNNCMLNSKLLDKIIHELLGSDDSIPNSTIPAEQCVYRLLLYNKLKNKEGISKAALKRVFVLINVTLNEKELEQISMKFPSNENGMFFIILSN